METTAQRAQRLLSYYQQYQAGTLDNEPARLLATYLDGEVTRLWSPQNVGEVIERMLEKGFGGNGELGGIKNSAERGVEYTILEDGVFCDTDLLLGLAAQVDANPSDPAPLPYCWDHDWDDDAEIVEEDDYY